MWLSLFRNSMEEVNSFLGVYGATFIVGVPALFLLYWYATRNHDYWKRQGVPHPKPYPFFGSILEVVSKTFHGVELDRYKKYGPVYGHYEGRTPVLSVADPILLKDIMVKDFHIFPNRRDTKIGNDLTQYVLSTLQGEDWKRVRTIITPTFTTGKIKRLLSIIKDSAKTLMNNFHSFAEKGEPVEAKSIYGTFAMDVIASAAFSTKLDSRNDPNNIFISMAMKFFPKGISWRFVMFLLFPGVMRLFRIGIFPPTALNFFADVTLRIIQERKKTGKKGNDFLQLMLDTAEQLADEGKLESIEKEEDNITTNYGKIDSDQVIKNTRLNKSLSFEELVAQSIVFFLAGYHTTASTLAFATYILALNPDVQEKLIWEIDEAAVSSNGELTYEAIQNMKYLDNVISETLRIYPPGIRLDRTAEMDYKLGDTDITIPKGMIVTIPVYAIHRDAKYYPDPEKFDPDRFSPENRAKRDLYTYLPFGAGPRNCVGMRFALMEVKVGLAMVLSHFRIKKCPQTKVPLEFGVGLGQGVLAPKEIMVKMEIRKGNIKFH